MQWIVSDKETIAAAGRATFVSIVAIKKNEEINADLCRKLLERVAKTIHTNKNRVRQAMNNFLKYVGGYCSQLSTEALTAESKLGKVYIEMSGTACKVPDATGYIQKMHQRGCQGKKRKSARC